MWKFLIIRKNKSGILLFEVMLTLVILAIGLTLILHSFSASLNASKIAQDYTVASLLIEDKMWEMENAGAVGSNLTEEGQFLPPYQKFNWRLQTKDKPVQDETGKLNEVKLTVRWKEGRRKGSASATTYLKNKLE